MQTRLNVAGALMVSVTTNEISAAVAIDAAAVAQLLGISQSHFFALLRMGRFGPMARRLGRAKRYSRSEVLAWFEAGCPSRAHWQAEKGVKS